MKKLLMFISLFVVMTFLAACVQAEEAAILTVEGQEYSQSELENLGTMAVDYTDKDGETTTYQGVLLSDLLNDAGVNGEMVTFTAIDGYEAEMPMDEAMACGDCILAFDDGRLRMVMPGQSSKLQVKDVVNIKVE